MNKLLYFTVILYIVYYVAYIHVINCNKASIFKSLSLVKKTQYYLQSSYFYYQNPVCMILIHHALCITSTK